MSGTRTATVAAPAKVNLLLRVLGRRDDGYHELDTLFQGIELSDAVEVRVEEVREPVLPGLDVEGPDLGPVESNLAWRAARDFLAATGRAARVDVRLVKRIPAGGGLGGGSSDAAAVLRALSVLLGPPPRDALAGVAAGLGSDVPFFLQPTPLARGRGRGERLEALEPLPPADVVVVLPPVHVSTARAYAELARGDVIETPDVGAAAPRSWDAVAGIAVNDFETVVPPGHAEIATSLAMLRACGAAPALLSGSGAACFGVFRDRAAAAAAAAELRERLPWPVVETRTLARWPIVEVR